jgi:hypothetical protein
MKINSTVIKKAPYSYSCLPNNSVKQAYSCRTRIIFDLVAILVTKEYFELDFDNVSVPMQKDESIKPSNLTYKCAAI